MTSRKVAGNALINIKIQPSKLGARVSVSRGLDFSDLCRRGLLCVALAHFSSAFVYEICNFLILPVILISLLFIPSSRLPFSRFHRLPSALSQSEFYCLSSLPPFPSPLQLEHRAEYHITRNCITLSLFFITAALIRLKLLECDLLVL